MKSRILLKEIPANKFHSAIFTTYSINLYYLEQQVLPLLGSKGIHYVSILTDGAMLSAHLEGYGYLSQKRKRNYAIHGMQSRGAFHPKLIFLAGTDSLLLLLGSGNLTSSGHGKNLEVWNSIYINSLKDTKLGFVIQAWNYLKELHSNLGESAINKIKSIEENCRLLATDTSEDESVVFELDKQTKISFHANRENGSLFNQLSQVIGDEVIERITIMSPFYDSKGRFIKELNSRYKPKQINVIVQENFGALPCKMASQKNIRFFDWNEVMKEKHKQSYFHAKNIVFQGAKNNYLISGSANASVAAFGTSNIRPTNQESCVIYQSSQLDYHTLLSIRTGGNTIDLKDYKSEENNSSSDRSSDLHSLFIKSAEKNFDLVNLIIHSNEEIKNALVQLFDSKGVPQIEKLVSIPLGNETQHLSVPNGSSLMFGQVLNEGEVVSNKQFIIDINAFESTNPSPRNRSLNQIRKLIESGNFSTPKIIDYLNTIYRQKAVKKGISKPSLQEERNDDLPEEEDDDMIYLSYAEIQERAKQIDGQEKIHHYVEYKGVRLWESIFSYLKESRDKELQARIDEEETEDVDSSSGRSEKKEHKVKRAISTSSFDRLRDKVIRFLDSYYDILLAKTTDQKSEKPTLIDLSMYLIMIEILLHLTGHKETISEEKGERHLLIIPHSNKESSWSEYLLQFIGMFTMWSSQKKGFKDIDNLDYRLKLQHYQTMAFKTNLSALSICKTLNEHYENKRLDQWIHINLLNSNVVFNSTKQILNDTEEFISFIPQKVIDELGEPIIEESISQNLTFNNTYQRKSSDYQRGDFYYHSDLGYTFLSKIIKNTKNTFFKLFTPGFEWDEDLNNYWNGCVYCIEESRWLKSRKDKETNT